MNAEVTRQANRVCILAVLLLAGCAQESGTPEKTAEYPYTQYRIGAKTAYEFRLQDGTRCVMQYSAGVDCEWKGEERERREQ